LQVLRPQQVFYSVEDLFAGAATHQSRTQFQLIMRDPECRLAMRTLGRERHRDYRVSASWPDSATQPSCSAQTDISMNGA
jgi:hypothetical protein